MTTVTPIHPLPPDPPVPMTFAGRAGAFAGLVIRGSLLMLPTFGFSRFWLVTDIRRHLWSHTQVEGDAFEYTGTGRELLLGFLTALAILTPIYLVYALLGILAEEVQAFGSVPLFLILYVFGQYAAFRARRYRATRTTFRGLRFWMTGSGFSYAARAALWDLATVLTLGLAYPWRTAALERYKMRHTHFGDLQGAFVGRGGPFFRRGILLWLVGAALPLAGLILVGAWLWEAGIVSSALGVPALGFAMLSVVPAILVYPLFRAVQIRWTLEGLRFGPVRLESSLTRRKVFGIYARWILACLGYGVVVGAVAGALAFLFAGPFRAFLENDGDAGWTAIPVVAAVTLGYLVVLLGFGVLKRIFVDRALWAAVTLTTGVGALAALDGTLAAGQAAGSTGEGLADALDVGAF